MIRSHLPNGAPIFEIRWANKSVYDIHAFDPVSGAQKVTVSDQLLVSDSSYKQRTFELEINIVWTRTDPLIRKDIGQATNPIITWLAVNELCFQPTSCLLHARTLRKSENDWPLPATFKFPSLLYLALCDTLLSPINSDAGSYKAR